MYTVTIVRTVASAPARHPRETGLQYASLDALQAALRGDRVPVMQSMTRLRCRTRAGAWGRAWRARLSGASAKITRGDLPGPGAQIRWDLAGRETGLVDGALAKAADGLGVEVVTLDPKHRKASGR